MSKKFTERDIETLAHKYKSGMLTPDEQAHFDAWYLNHDDRTFAHSEAGDPERVKDRLLAHILAGTGLKQKRNIAVLWPRIAAAASIIAALSFGAYFLLHKNPAPVQVAVLKPGTFKNDVLPAQHNAYITLGNGQRVILNAATKGSLALQGNTHIIKENGAIVYQPADNSQSELVYNTLVVPRGGGKRELRLADGTLAVLDAGSSIRFPVAFTGKERLVSITGQVYFEVVHNSTQPFKVSAKGQTIEDIGTHFNINSFEDEPVMKVTLVEGSVRFAEHTLTPGQQAVAGATITIEKNVDLGQVLAWKNDKFDFTKNTSLQAVMRQLARWYDLDVSYQGTSKQYHLAGDMPRDSKLSDVLKILEYNGLQFSIDGKKLTVYQ